MVKSVARGWPLPVVAYADCQVPDWLIRAIPIGISLIPAFATTLPNVILTSNVVATQISLLVSTVMVLIS